MPVELFFCYAHEDEALLNKLKSHLRPLQREGLIDIWHDREINAGAEWEEEIRKHLNEAKIVLLLISPDFMASEYCYNIEMTQAMERHAAGKACVLPIVLRPTDWKEAPFGALQCLPENAKAVTRWRDRDEAFLNITEGIRKVITELISHLPVGATTFPVIWNIPYLRNPLFVGRDEILSRIRTHLQAGQRAAHSQPQAISGLGGIGKTQTAVEYAYRYCQDYQAILWTRADIHEALVSGYVTIAELLDLPEKEEPNQTITIQAVMKWFVTHSQWLLILDNADDLSILRSFLPTTSSGHILLTTRAQAMGRLAQGIEVDTMHQDVGATLLLRRAGLIAQHATLEAASPADIAVACEISETLGGLPLALDQAGAYIEESQCGLSDYQQLYRSRRTGLLKKRGSFVDDYPGSVATTWSLSFQGVEQKSSLAAALLRCCAFLHPDAIPENIITSGAAYLGPQLQRLARDPLALNHAIAVLRAYSLIRRDPSTATLSIHRLVQAVLRDTMSKKTARQWRERVARALNAAFPEATFEVWARCEQLLPHVLLYSTWVEDELVSIPEIARMFNEAGVYARDRAQYAQAETLLIQSLKIREQQFGTTHPFTANSLNSLANLYRRQGKVEKAELLYIRALAIREQGLGVDHPDTARILNNLGNLYRDIGKYKEAEPLYTRALAIDEQQLGPRHPDTAHTLNNLAILYYLQRKYEEAEPLYRRVLAIREQHLGPEHPRTAQTLNDLADLYRSQSKYEEAEPLHQRALKIREQHLGPGHPDTATSLTSLADLYTSQSKYEEAEPLYQRALTIQEYTMGIEHPDTQVVRNKYVALLHLMDRDAEAPTLATQYRQST